MLALATVWFDDNNVCSWHLADIDANANHVRSWE
jgi:hypothetical protein